MTSRQTAVMNRVGAVAVAALEVLADVVRAAVADYAEAVADIENETTTNADLNRAVASQILPRYGRNPDGLQVLKAAQGIIRRAALDRSMVVSLPEITPAPFAEHFRGLLADPKPGGIIKRLSGGCGVASAAAAMIAAGSVIRLTAIHTEIEDEALAVALDTMADYLAYGLNSEAVLAADTARMNRFTMATGQFMAAAASSVAD